MKKIIIFLLIFQFCWQGTHAQKANYKLARKMITPVVFSMEVKPNFLSGSDKFWFVYKTNESVRYFFVDPKNKTMRDLFDNASFAKGIEKITKLKVDPNLIDIPYLEFADDHNTFDIYVDRYRLTYDLNKGEFTDHQTIDPNTFRPAATTRNPGLSPDGRYEIFARNHNLYVRETETGNVKQLTSDGELYNSYAAQENDTRTDTDVPSKARWLADSKRVVFSRHDSRNVGEISLINNYTPRPSVVTYKYMMPGDKNVTQYYPGIIDVGTGQLTEINIAKWKDQLVDIMYASPTSDFVYLLRKNRQGTQVELCRADTKTGEVRVLINETSLPYLNDDLLQISILNGGKDIIWFSERTDWGHLYHYDGNGKLLNQITSGQWTAGKILHVDTARREIYFEGYGFDKKLNPYYRQILKANIDKGGAKALTPEDANHNVIMSPMEGYMIDNYSRVDTHPVSVLRDKNGKVILELAKADLSEWEKGGWGMPERFTVKAKDGVTDLYGVMWKPANFDPTKKYPVITHVYPGPQSENVLLNFHPTGGFDGPVAQLGFVVVMFGNRGGSPLRGREYHTFGYGNLRDYAIDDNKHGLEQLAERYSFIDIDRVGIFGNSGGGMMTFAALCKYPDFYKTGVSASGNHDNRIFNKWWVETHHGVNQRVMNTMDFNGTTRKDSVFVTEPPTNLELAPLLKCPFMLVTGDMDDNVHPAQTFRLASVLMMTAKNFELVVLPGNGHDFVKQGLRFYQYKMWFHFARHLLGDNSADDLVDLSKLGTDDN